MFGNISAQVLVLHPLCLISTDRAFNLITGNDRPVRLIRNDNGRHHDHHPFPADTGNGAVSFLRASQDLFHLFLIHITQDSRDGFSLYISDGLAQHQFHGMVHYSDSALFINLQHTVYRPLHGGGKPNTVALLLLNGLVQSLRLVNCIPH